MTIFRSAFGGLALFALYCVPGRCDLMAVSNNTGSYVSVGATLTFTNYNGSNSSSTSGTPTANTSLAVALAGLSIPVGSSLNSAFLDLSLTPSGPLNVWASRSETDYQYTVQTGSYYVCTNYYWGSCHSGYWVPTYSTVQGSGGSADLSATATNQFTWLSDGYSSVALPGVGGHLDLVALGFGPSVLAGRNFAVYAQAQVGLSSNILNYGNWAQTTYNFSSYENVAASGRITADYTAPPPPPPVNSVPEPNSVVTLVMLASGVAILSRHRFTK